MLNAYRQHILDFARPHRSPTVRGVRAYAEEGCLIAYAANLFEMHRRATVFIDKLLKGATPRDMPVEQPTKFESGPQPQDCQGAGDHDAAIAAPPGR